MAQEEIRGASLRWVMDPDMEELSFVVETEDRGFTLMFSYSQVCGFLARTASAVAQFARIKKQHLEEDKVVVQKVEAFLKENSGKPDSDTQAKLLEDYFLKLGGQ